MRALQAQKGRPRTLAMALRSTMVRLLSYIYIYIYIYIIYLHIILIIVKTTSERECNSLSFKAGYLLKDWAQAHLGPMPVVL